MTFTLAGLALLSVAWSFEVILFAVALVGVGSSVFHPEASRVARMASGDGTALPSRSFRSAGMRGRRLGRCSPRWIIVSGGQTEIKWFCLIALVGIILLLSRPGAGTWRIRTC